MRFLPRVRLLLARRPWIYWLGVTAITAVIAVSVARAVSAVDEQRSTWGETANVVVASKAIAPGDALVASAQLVALPVAMVPPSALRSIPAGLALHHIAVGEVVVRTDVSDTAGPAALLPTGWLGVTVDVEHPQLFVVGDRVVVFAFSQIVAPDTIVTVVGEDFVVIGVDPDEASRVADAAHQQLAVLALSASPPPPQSAQ